MTQILERERAKYDELWSSVAEYRMVTPGLESVDRFMEIVKPKVHQKFRPASLLDIGCGTGRAGLKFSELGFDAWWLDFSEVGLVAEVPRDRFIQMAAWDRYRASTNLWWDYGYCTDLMEHIPVEFTMLTLHRILSSCRLCWFQIYLVPDVCGERIDEQLHVTVKPFTWWLDHFHALGAEVLDARDLLNEGFYLVRRGNRLGEK